MSSKANLQFRHHVIDATPPGAEHDITLLADINGDGRLEVIIGGKQGPPNLFWYENPGWKRHDMAEAPQLEAGGLAVDINRNGQLDIVAGQQWGGRELYWFENPPDPTQSWTKHVIDNRFNKYHDQAWGDVDGDGEPELVVLSQLAQVLVYYDIPADPTVEPWPESCCHVVAENTGEQLEGLLVTDLDGTGQPVIVAGPNVFRRAANGKWERECLGPDFVMARAAVGDLLGTGGLDLVVCEGESNPGRLAIFPAQDRKCVLLRDDLFHPHSLALADFDGSGTLDIFVAEMGLGRNPNPRMMIFRNQGNGRFEPEIIQTGIPTHEAKVADMTGNGLPDIVGKPYDPEHHIDIWFNETVPSA